jgi:predicted MFS family arabinose efflux permease
VRRPDHLGAGAVPGVSGTAHRSHWGQVVAFGLVAASSQVVWLTYAPVTTSAATHFGVSEAAVGWLANVFPLLYVVMAIPAGMLLDRWFPKALAAGAVVTCLGACLRLGSDSYTLALVGQALAAAANPLLLNAITGVAGRNLKEEDRPRGIALVSAGIFAGMLGAFVLGTVFPDPDDVNSLVVISTACLVPGAAALVASLRIPVRHDVAPPTRGLSAVRSAAGDVFVRRLCALVFIPFGTFVALATFGQPLLEPAGVGVDLASLTLLFTVLVGALGSCVLPVFAVRRNLESRMLLVALVASALACVALALLPGFVIGGIAFAAIGFFLLPAMPITLGLLERHSREAEGTASGLIWMAGNLGGIVVATLVGLLLDRPFAAFLLCAAALLVTVPLVRTLRAGMQEPLPNLPEVAA